MLDPLNAPEKVVQAPLYHVPEQLLTDYARPFSDILTKRIQTTLIKYNNRDRVGSTLIYGKIVKRLSDNSMIVDCDQRQRPLQKKFADIRRTFGGRDQTVQLTLRAETKLVEGDLIMVAAERTTTPDFVIRNGKTVQADPNKQVDFENHPETFQQLAPLSH